MAQGRARVETMKRTRMEVGVRAFAFVKPSTNQASIPTMGIYSSPLLEEKQRRMRKRRERERGLLTKVMICPMRLEMKKNAKNMTGKRVAHTRALSCLSG
jgi:hypothetical protein